MRTDTVNGGYINQTKIQNTLRTDVNIISNKHVTDKGMRDILFVNKQMNKGTLNIQKRWIYKMQHSVVNKCLFISNC